MTGGDSVFSCLTHPPAAPDATRRMPAPGSDIPVPAPPPPPPPPPPAVPTGQFDDMAAKIAELEDKVKKLEAKEPAPVYAVADALKEEMTIAQRRITELERVAAGLLKVISAAAKEREGEKEAISQVVDRFKGELAALRFRAGAVEELCRGIGLQKVDGLAVGLGLLERRLENLESGVATEINERFAALDSAFAEIARKASLAQETASGSARSVDKIEERTARLPYLENRLAGDEQKLERIYEVEAGVQALKTFVESVENKFSGVKQATAGISAEHKQIRSDFESISHQVKHLTILFNHFRTELSFLLPKKKESVGDD